jgi:hypothetical protein
VDGARRRLQRLHAVTPASRGGACAHW